MRRGRLERRSGDSSNNDVNCLVRCNCPRVHLFHSFFLSVALDFAQSVAWGSAIGQLFDRLINGRARWRRRSRNKVEKHSVVSAAAERETLRWRRVRCGMQRLWVFFCLFLVSFAGSFGLSFCTFYRFTAWHIWNWNKFTFSGSFPSAHHHHRPNESQCTCGAGRIQTQI